MTDNEIIKALKCCGNVVDSTCKECVYHETYNASCVVRLMRDALDLINRQKAEIERKSNLLGEAVDRFAKMKEAMERKRKFELRTVESEAIKEFAERLKKKYKHNKTSITSLVTLFDNINNLVKEMCGE